MTCAQCQELLLDLAYGELDAARAAELELHLAGCAGCRAEQAKLARTRAAFAPLWSSELSALEEPRAGFDAPILAAAREAARLATASARPALALVPAAPAAEGSGPPLAGAPTQAQTARRGRWLRAAAAGSIAAAAALAVVVSTGGSKHPLGDSPRPADAPSRPASAEKGLESARGAADGRGGAGAGVAYGSGGLGPRAREDAARGLASADAKDAPVLGALGSSDLGAAESKKKLALALKPAAASALPAHADEQSQFAPRGPQSFAPPPPSAKSESAPVTRAASPGEEPARAASPGGVAADQASEESREAAPSAAALAPPPVVGGVIVARADAPAPAEIEGAPPAPPPASPARASPAGADDPALLESRAMAARGASALGQAAQLFHAAARARLGASDTGLAARDLSLAVSCYAALGRLGEARALRAEIAALSPAQPDALSSADAALAAPPMRARDAAPARSASAPASDGQ